MQNIPAAIATMPQSYIDRYLTEVVCYKCRFATATVPCSNCGHDAPLVTIGESAPLTGENQGHSKWL